MSRVFEAYIDNLSKKSGYSYDYLIDRFDEMIEDDGELDMDYFTGVTLEKDW